MDVSKIIDSNFYKNITRVMKMNQSIINSQKHIPKNLININNVNRTAKKIAGSQKNIQKELTKISEFANIRNSFFHNQPYGQLSDLSFTLDKEKLDLANQIADLDNMLKSVSEVFSKNIPSDYFEKLAAEYGDDFSDELLVRYRQIKKKYKSVKKLQKLIIFVLNLIRKRLRNLKQVFYKNHSFHFKNLDDYHSLNLNHRYTG